MKDEVCENCRPKVVNLETGEEAPSDMPGVALFRAYWSTISSEDRALFHRVLCLKENTIENLTAFIATVSRLAKELQDTKGGH